VAKAGLSGLLWTPEVRDARTPEELIRRLQSAVLSPMALINAWYIKNPPWKQVERDANNEGRFAEGWEAVEEKCRRVLELRMRLVPYLHAAFVRYHREGLPPFRPLVMDHPDDVQCWPVDDQFLVGDGLLVAPVVAGQSTRAVYLPEGEWFEYWSGRRYTGRQRIEIEVPLDQIPLFVRSGTLLPLAAPTLHTDDPRSGELTVLAYGDTDAALTLYEEEGEHAPTLTEVRLSWEAGRGRGALRRTGPARAPGYRVTEWKAVK
jgi:alpha-D-xyloside xylohydrolase